MTAPHKAGAKGWIFDSPMLGTIQSIASKQQTTSELAEIKPMNKRLRELSSLSMVE
jgi:hypothetical protein